MRKLILYFALPCLLGCGNSLYAQWSITAANTNTTQNFDAMGSGTTLPSGWQIISPRSAGIGFVDFAVNAGGISGTATGAAYNYGVGSDRAIGMLNSGTYTSGKYVVLQITNNTGGPINNITLSWNYEKYRNGSRSWTWNFYHGTTSGASTGVAAGDHTYAADGENSTNSNPPQSVAKTVTITGLNIPAGSSYYFRWVLTGSGGSTNGQGLAIDNVVINAGPACTPGTPAVALGNDVSYCAGSPFSLTLNAQNPGASYDWNNGAATTQTYAVTGAGTYTVKVTDAGGCIGRDTLVVTQNPTPIVNLGNDAEYCAGTSFSQVLDAQNPGAAYDWNNGAATTQTFTANGAGTYTVKVTNGNGCIGRDTLLVTENALPIVNLGNDTAYCLGTPFSWVLNAQNNGATYNWNNGAATTQTYTANTAGTYSVTVTDANGCENDDQVTVTQHSLPVVNLGNDTAFCSGTAFVLTLNAHNAGADFDWNSGAAHTQMYQVSVAGTYSVVVTDDNGCQGTDQIVISNNSLPNVYLGNDTAYCTGTPFSLVLNAQNPGAAYNWNNGAASTQTFTANGAGTYTVTVTDANGCQGTGDLTITQYALPIVNLGNDASYCIGSSFSLLLDAGNPGATYSWNGGGLTAQIFAVSQAGTYSVVVTDVHGCSASDAVLVTENPLPVVDLEDGIFFCQGTAFSLALDAGNPGADYNWNNGAGSAQTFTANGAGMYSVIVTDANGCVNGDTTEITAMPLPVVELGNDTAFCAGTVFALLLDAQNIGASYSWNGGVANTQTFVADEAGTYTVNVTDVFGCTNSGSITITENALPNLNLGNNITTTNPTQVLNAGPGFTEYLWFPGGQTTAQITINQSGTYSVTVSNGNGCTASDSIQVSLINTSSITEVETAGFSVFPNPSSGMFNIRTEENGPYTIHVYSLSGQGVYTQNSSEPSTQMDISQVPAGTYLLQVRGSHPYAMQRIIITR